MLTLPLLTPEQCDALIAQAAQVRERPVCEGHDQHLIEKILESNNSRISRIELQPWMKAIALDVLARGAAHFGYEGTPQLHTSHPRCVPRVATYREGTHFKWHLDIPHPDYRWPAPTVHWIALSVQLTAGADYEGGDLMMEDESIRACRERGWAALLIGHTKHQVSPVTRGVRQSFVCWGEIPVEPKVESYKQFRARMEESRRPDLRDLLDRAELDQRRTGRKPGECAG